MILFKRAPKGALFLRFTPVSGLTNGGAAGYNENTTCDRHRRSGEEHDMATKKGGPSRGGSNAATTRAAKKLLRKIPAAVKVLMVLLLLVGIAGGYFAVKFVSKNDHFVLKGQTTYSVEAGAGFTYRDEGVDAVCFGRDVSGKTKVETTLQKNAAGEYIIPDEEGVYTITYTVDCLKFGDKNPNGQIKRIRTFSVSVTEGDGQGE